MKTHELFEAALPINWLLLRWQQGDARIRRTIRIVVNIGKNLTEEYADWIVTQLTPADDELSREPGLGRRGFVSYNITVSLEEARRALKILRRLSRGIPKFTISQYVGTRVIDIELSELEE